MRDQTLLKKFIFLANFILKFCWYKILINFVMKKTITVNFFAKYFA